MRLGHIIAALVLSHATHALADDQDLVVVVGRGSAVSSVSAYEIGHVFLGRLTGLQGVGAVHPLELRDDHEARLRFHAEIVGMSEHKLRAHWAAMVLTGRARPPQRVGSIEELKERLKADAKAIAYVRREQLDGSLKQVYP